MTRFFEKCMVPGREYRFRGGYWYEFRWHKRKLLANEDAGDAREYGYNARVVPSRGGWMVLIRRGKKL